MTQAEIKEALESGQLYMRTVDTQSEAGLTALGTYLVRVWPVMKHSMETAMREAA